MVASLRPALFLLISASISLRNFYIGILLMKKLINKRELCYYIIIIIFLVSSSSLPLLTIIIDTTNRISELYNLCYRIVYRKRCSDRILTFFFHVFLISPKHANRSFTKAERIQSNENNDS